MKPAPSPVKRAVARLRRMLPDTRGATAVEYGLILALVFLTLLVGVTQVGRTTSTMWNNVGNAVERAR